MRVSGEETGSVWPARPRSGSFSHFYPLRLKAAYLLITPLKSVEEASLSCFEKRRKEALHNFRIKQLVHSSSCQHPAAAKMAANHSGHPSFVPFLSFISSSYPVFYSFLLPSFFLPSFSSSTLIPLAFLLTFFTLPSCFLLSLLSSLSLHSFFVLSVNHYFLLYCASLPIFLAFPFTPPSLLSCFAFLPFIKPSFSPLFPLSFFYPSFLVFLSFWIPHFPSFLFIHLFLCSLLPCPYFSPSCIFTFLPYLSLPHFALIVLLTCLYPCYLSFFLSLCPCFPLSLGSLLSSTGISFLCSFLPPKSFLTSHHCLL